LYQIFYYIPLCGLAKYRPLKFVVNGRDPNFNPTPPYVSRLDGRGNARLVHRQKRMIQSEPAIAKGLRKTGMHLPSEPVH